MKKSCCRTIVVLLMAMLYLSCQDENAAEPYLTASGTKEAVLGKWKILKIDYKFCRSGSCNGSNYTGLPGDYFEFRLDSAFLVHKSTTSNISKEAFKADYTLPGAFILSQMFWSVKYNVKECNASRMVLECSYIGSDPYAKFTDTYYLYR